MTIKTILFDVGGVILTPLDMEAMTKRSDQLSQQLGFTNGSELLGRFFANSEWRATRIGERTWAQMIDEILTPHGLTSRSQQEQFVNQLFEFEGVQPEMVALIESLYGRYQLGILSNASDRLEARLDGLGVSQYFDPIVNSYRIGAAKPDERAYEIALQQLNAPAEQVFFIDDREWNTKAAEAMGMTCHVFTNIAALKADLEDLSLL